LASTETFTTMLKKMMRNVSSHSLMISIMENSTLEAAGLGGVASGRGAHLKIKMVPAMTAGTKTVSKTVALARRFARPGIVVSLIAMTLKIAVKTLSMNSQLNPLLLPLLLPLLPLQ